VACALHRPLLDGPSDRLKGTSAMHDSTARDEDSARKPAFVPLPPRVLMVESDQDLADLVRFELETSGYHVEITSSVSGALRRLHEDNQFALVIGDVQLRGRSGLQLLFAEDSAGKLPAVLMMSAVVSPELRHFVEGMGAAIVEKPFSFAILHANVVQVLRMAPRTKTHNPSRAGVQ
jgi:DNA-binding response OmpR family regulator